jgi:dolichol-phosphate mannosyltransferase
MSAARKPIQSPLVIVPTFNEKINIENLLPRLRREVPNASVLIVDDNSPDGTADVVKRFATEDPRVFLLSREKKEGLGKAYLAGFAWGLERGFDALVEMDADFSHDPADVSRLIQELAKCDVAIGCRYMAGGATPGWSLRRKWISQGGNIYARAVLGLPYRDLTGGFNAWRAEVLRKIDLPDVKSKGYAFQVELKYRASLNRFEIHEIPIVFRERTEGVSKMSANIVKEAAVRVPSLRKLKRNR